MSALSHVRGHRILWVRHPIHILAAYTSGT
jgi:hypothetical protein